MSLAAARTESSGRIPVLDIGAYLAGEAGAAAPLARAIARTCEDTGFLVVANHGVPQRLVDDTFAVAQQFFARPEGDKLVHKVGKYNIGYLPFGWQVVRHSPVNKNTRPNFSESFYITRDRAPDHPDIVNNKPLVGLNRWPEDMPELRAATTAYYRAMEAMTTRLVPLFALAPGPASRLFRRGLRRAELHDSPDPLPAAPVARGQRVRLRAAYRQQLHHVPGAVEAPRTRSAHRRGRLDQAAGGAGHVRRQYRGDAGALLERSLPGDASPRDQSQRSLALRLPVLPRAEPRCRRRAGPELRRPRQPAQVRADHLRRVHPAPADPQLRPPPGRRKRRVRGVGPGTEGPPSSDSSGRASRTAPAAAAGWDHIRGPASRPG